jgi:acetyl esterase/lipase
MKLKTTAAFVFLILIAPFLIAEPRPAAPPASPEVPSGTRVYPDISYIANGHELQKLDLYLPEHGENLPLIVWIHGGAWRSGGKEQLRASHLLDFLAEGYAIASVNYRLSQHATFPAQIQDCKAAVRWLRANAERYGLDPDRFGAWGPSAGGHLAALLGTAGDTREFDTGENLDYSSRVQAVVDFFGPTDFLQMDAHRLPEGLVHGLPDSPEAHLVGGPIEDNRDKVAQANPITYITEDDPPFLIVHGDADPLVPHHQSELLADALKKAGIPVVFYTVKGGKHGGFNDPKAQQQVKEFFAEHLKRGGGFLEDLLGIFNWK